MKISGYNKVVEFVVKLIKNDSFSYFTLDKKKGKLSLVWLEDGAAAPCSHWTAFLPVKDAGQTPKC